VPRDISLLENDGQSKTMIENASILVTGGTGAFGSAFARYAVALPDPPKRLVIYSRGEYRQFLMSQELTPIDYTGCTRFLIGDVRDRARLRRALNGIDIVIHAAALKRIEVGQYNPLEMKKTNVDGAENLIEATQDSNVKKVVFLSSDKAFEPVSPYGLSKAMAESLFLEANNTTGWTGPKFSICRYGNVWASTGSVVPIWKVSVLNGQPIEVRDPDATRFFMRMSEAIELVLKTIAKMKGGEINVPTLPAYRIGDLATAVGAKEINITSLPPWEKRHESMAQGNSSDKARRMSIDELKAELAA